MSYRPLDFAALGPNQMSKNPVIITKCSSILCLKICIHFANQFYVTQVGLKFNSICNYLKKFDFL